MYDIGIVDYNTSLYNKHDNGALMIDITTADMLDIEEGCGSVDECTRGELIQRLKALYPGYGCGYENGVELLAYYTMAETSFLLFMCVTVATTICMAWQVAESETQDREVCGVLIVHLLYALYIHYIYTIYTLYIHYV